MILLNGSNAGWQTFVMTLQEAITWEGSVTHYLMEFTNKASNNVYRCILNVIEDNPRYTMAQIQIDNENPLNGEVLCSERGQFEYTIYGQNSASNLNPAGEDVVGVVEIGILQITGESVGQFPALNIPANVVYYE